MSATTEDIEALAERAYNSLIRRGKTGISAMELILNDACNLACSYCFEQKSHKRWMPLDIGRQAIDHLLDADSLASCKRLFFFGGEPFLSWPHMRDLADYARTREPSTDSLKIGVTTNGTIYPKDADDVLLRNSIAVLISIDAGKQAHDRHRIYRNGRASFEKVWGNVSRMIAANIEVSVRVSVGPDTLDDVTDFVEKCADANVRNILVGTVVPANWTPDAIRSFTKICRDLSQLNARLRNQDRRSSISLFDGQTELKDCSAGRSLVSITPEGNVFGCSRLALGDRGRGVHRLTDLHTFKLDPVAVQRIASGTRASGCAAVNFEEHGDVLVPSNSLAQICDAIEPLLKEQGTFN